MIRDRLVVYLHADAKEDLKDGWNSIQNLLPTPGAMMLLRVAERIIRKIRNADRIATKIGPSSPQESGNTFLKDLEKSQLVKGHLLSYLDYPRTKRNEAQHPHKRFSQQESEDIFVHIRNLLTEIQQFDNT